MNNFFKLLALVAEFSVVCRDDWHCEAMGADYEIVLLEKVCLSAAGYYLGYWCPVCGPYDRVSMYYRDRESAEKALRYELEDYLASLA